MSIINEKLIGQDKDVIKKVNVAGAVIKKTDEEGNDYVLLIQRDADDHWPLIWEFPRGKCDKGDSKDIEKCLQREVKEETGLDVEIIEYIDKYTYIADHGKRESTQYNYLCKAKNSEQKIKLSKEHQDYKWISSVGEAELLIPSEMKKTISRAFNKDSSIVNYPKSKEVIEEKYGDKKMKNNIKLAESLVDKYLDNMLTEESSYHKCFRGMLAKFGVKSLNSLDDEKKKEFFIQVKKSCK